MSVPWLNEDLYIFLTLRGARHAKSPEVRNLKLPLESSIATSCADPRVPICERKLIGVTPTIERQAWDSHSSTQRYSVMSPELLTAA